MTVNEIEKSKRQRQRLKNSPTISYPVAGHIEPESSVAPLKSFRNYLFHHRHVQIDGVVQKQGVD